MNKLNELIQGTRYEGLPLEEIIRTSEDAIFNNAAQAWSHTQRSMHTPVPDPQEDEEEPDMKQPPVPPDQEPEIIPQRDPPKPGESSPMIAYALA